MGNISLGQYSRVIEMKKAILTAVFLVISVLGSSQAIADLIETFTVVNPDSLIVHDYTPPDPPFDGMVEEHMEISLPSAVLSPGDIYRVNVSFTDGKQLKVINDAEGVYMNCSYKTPDGGGGFTVTNDGSVSLNITESYNVLNTEQSGPTSGYRSLGYGYSFSEGFDFVQSEGEFLNGSLFAAFTVDFHVPATVDGKPFSVQTYSNNRVVMSIHLNSTDSDKNLWEIITPPPSGCNNPPSTDTNNDCKIDLYDFANMAAEWLMCGFDDPNDC